MVRVIGPVGLISIARTLISTGEHRNPNRNDVSGGAEREHTFKLKRARAPFTAGEIAMSEAPRHYGSHRSR